MVVQLHRDQRNKALPPTIPLKQNTTQFIELILKSNGYVVFWMTLALPNQIPLFSAPTIRRLSDSSATQSLINIVNILILNIMLFESTTRKVTLPSNISLLPAMLLISLLSPCLEMVSNTFALCLDSDPIGLGHCAPTTMRVEVLEAISYLTSYMSHT